jgi:hypothetical protein
MRQIMREDVEIKPVRIKLEPSALCVSRPDACLRIDDRPRTTYNLVQQSAHRT